MDTLSPYLGLLSKERLKRVMVPAIMVSIQPALLAPIIIFSPLHFNRLGFEGWQIGMLLAIFPLTSLLFSLPFGLMNDQFVPRRLAALGLTLLLCFFAALRLGHSFWSFFALFFLGGFGNTLYTTSMESLIYKSLGERFKGQKLSFFTASGILGFGLGSFASGYLLSSGDFHQLSTAAIVLVAPLIVLSFFLEKTYSQPPPLGGYRQAFQSPSFILLALVVLLFSFHYGAEATSLSLFLEVRLGLLEKGIGFFVLLTIFFLVFCALFTGNLIDRGAISPTRLFAYGVLLSGLGNIFFVYTFGFKSALATRFLHVIGDGIILVTSKTAIAHFFEAEKVGGGSGMMATTSTFGYLAGSLLCGLIGGLWGFQYPFLLTGLLAVLAFLIVWVGRRHFPLRLGVSGP